MARELEEFIKSFNLMDQIRATVTHDCHHFEMIKKNDVYVFEKTNCATLTACL